MQRPEFIGPTNFRGVVVRSMFANEEDPFDLFFSGNPITGSANSDIIMSQTENNTINAGDGNDLILANIGLFRSTTSSNNSFANANDLDNNNSIWSTDTNPLFGDDSIPHASVWVDTDAATQEYFEINLTAGQTLIVDIDAGFGDFGTSLSVDTVVEIYNAAEVFQTSDDDSLVSEGGLGSSPLSSGSTITRDSYLEFTAPSTGTYFIKVREFGGDGNFEGDERFLLQVSLEGHAVGAVNTTGAETVNGGAGDDLILGVEGNDILNGDDGEDRIYGGVGNDIADGGDGDDLIFGEAGDDVLSGGNGNDTIDGGSGEDSLIGNAGNDRIDGGSRADEIFGGSGADTISGNSGNDRLNGGSGNDRVEGGADDDFINGGPDNDTLLGGGGNDEFVGGSGIDTVDFSGASGPVNVDFVAGTATGEGSDTLQGIENITGSGFDDFLYGDLGNNTIDGRGGEDFIDGRSGNDILLGGTRADEMFGGSGNDTLSGQAGNDRLNGGSGDDTVMGGGDDDLLVGGPGNDILIGGAGIDNMIGGSGNDNFVFDAGSGNDSITGFQAGAGSVDTLDFSALGISFGDLNIANQGGNTLVQTPGGDTVLLIGVTPGQLDQASDFIF